MTKRMRPHLWAKVWDWIWAKVGAEKEAQEGSALIAAIRLSPTQCWDAGSVVKISQCWDAEILTQPPVVKISQSWPSLLLSVFLTRFCLRPFAWEWWIDCTGWVMFGCTGLHKLWYPGIRDRSAWGKFGAHGEHGDVFLFSNLGALWFSENLIRYSLPVRLREVKNNLFSFKHSYLRHYLWQF